MNTQTQTTNGSTPTGIITIHKYMTNVELQDVIRSHTASLETHTLLWQDHWSHIFQLVSIADDISHLATMLCDYMIQMTPDFDNPYYRTLVMTAINTVKWCHLAQLYWNRMRDPMTD